MYLFDTDVMSRAVKAELQPELDTLQQATKEALAKPAPAEAKKKIYA